MIIYGVAFLIYLLLVLLYYATKVRFFAVFAIAILVVLAAFRGDVGTDAWIYNNYYDDVRANGCSAGELEPIFCLYSWTLGQISDNNNVINAFTAVLIALLLYMPLRAQHSKHAVALLVLVPVVYLDFAMNGIRSGIAYSLLFAITAHQSTILNRNRRSRLIAGAIVATGVHLSTILLAGLNYILSRSVSMKSLLRTSAVFLFVAVIVIYVAISNIQPLLIVRAIASLDSEPFSALSGYAPALTNLLLLLVANRMSAITSRTSVFLLFALNAASLVIARYTYNGIRLLQLLYFLECIQLCIYMRKKAGGYNLAFILAIVASSLILKVRNWENESEAGMTPTPFIPYSSVFRS